MQQINLAHPRFLEAASFRLQQLSNDICVSLEHGTATDLSHALRSVAKIDELTFMSSLRSREIERRQSAREGGTGNH
jgi:hypothetical protein